MSTADIGHEHDYIEDDPGLAGNEQRTRWVVGLTTAMMLVEVTAGYLTSSMALLADGWHMASHSAALAISLIAYRLARSSTARRRFSFGAGKFIPLGGYTSALVLGIVALLMLVESGQRLLAPVEINFNEAIVVASVGLAVNFLSAVILGWKGGHTHAHDSHEHGHHDHHHDHNLRSAYLHVLADALTSVLAIGALVIGKYQGAYWLDAAVGILGGVIILKWSIGLGYDTAWELLDGHSKAVNRSELVALVERTGVEVVDLHVWRIAPKATACELVVRTDKPKGTKFYRELVSARYNIRHLVIEERENA